MMAERDCPTLESVVLFAAIVLSACFSENHVASMERGFSDWKALREHAKRTLSIMWINRMRHLG